MRYLSVKLIFIRELYSTLDEICSSNFFFSTLEIYFLLYKITVGKCQSEHRLTAIIMVKSLDCTTLQTVS